MKAGRRRLTFHLIHHTHWDREWYLPRAAFQARLIPAIRELLDILERDPDARFTLDGQTVIIEDTLQVHPEWRTRLGRAVRSGQLDIGPWYILADEMIPTGESLIRNLQVGAKQCADLGARMDVMYSPDAFGHPAALPTLAREFGIPFATLWRGLGKSGSSPDLASWIAPDGNEILLYHLPSAGYEIGADLGELAGHLRARWQQVRDTCVARAITTHVAVFIGADHHAPAPDPAGLTHAIRAIEPDHHVQCSTLSEYFDAVAADATPARRIEGELRWSYGYTWTLQGVHATRSRMKRRHGLIELALLRRGEALSALAWRQDSPRALELSTLCTRVLLQCQFHDTLCGCSSDDVAREQEVRLTSIQAAERVISRRALDAVTGHDPDQARNAPAATRPALILWNPAARPRGGIVTAELTAFCADALVGPPSGRQPATGPGYQPVALRTSSGAAIPVQALHVRRGLERRDADRHYPDQDQVDYIRVAFNAPPIGGIGAGILVAEPSTDLPSPTALRATSRHLRNEFVEVRVGANGRVGVTDLRTGERFDDVMHLIDETDLGDSYTPYVPAGSAAVHATWDESPGLIADGPLIASLQLGFRINRGPARIADGRLVIVLHADSPIVRIRLDMDNRADDHRLRVRTRVGTAAAVTTGAAFGFEQRMPLDVDANRYPGEWPVATAPAHRFALAGDSTRALALLWPAFAEIEWTARGDLLHTVFRSTGQLSRPDLPSRPGPAGWDTAIPDAQERGRHLYEFAVAPVAPELSARIDLVEQLWEDTFLPLQTTFIRDCSGPLDTVDAPRIEIEGEGLVFSSLKAAEDGNGLILRCYNTRSSPVQGGWRLSTPIVAAWLARADESTIEDIELTDAGFVAIVVGSRAMSTVRIVLAR